MIEYLIDIDTELLLWFNSRHTEYWDVVMKMASGKLIWIPMYAALLFAFFRAYGWRSAVMAVALTALSVTIADQVGASLLRPIFERMRPSNPDNPISGLVHIVDGYRAGRYGFPSCHAANTFAVAVFTSMVFRRWKYSLFIFSWALLNCYSRVYLGVHYPGDLMAGIVIGSMSGLLCFFVGGLAAKYFHIDKLGCSDMQRSMTIRGKTMKYRPSDAVIAAGILTMCYILICGFCFSC